MAAVPDPLQPNLPTDVPPRLRDRGVGLLATFTVATLLMVAAITAVGLVGTWWVLAPVMLVDLGLTIRVVTGIGRLLSDDGD